MLYWMVGYFLVCSGKLVLDSFWCGDEVVDVVGNYVIVVNDVSGYLYVGFVYLGVM